nr:conserved hypothetical protein [Serratia symbiotica]
MTGILTFLISVACTPPYFYLNMSKQSLEPIPVGAKVVKFGRHTPLRLWINTLIYNFTPTYRVI